MTMPGTTPFMFELDDTACYVSDELICDARTYAQFGQEYGHMLSSTHVWDWEMTFKSEENRIVEGMYFNLRNEIRHHGFQPFGIGYPMHIEQQGDKYVAAPLLIWQCDIRPHSTKEDVWVFARTNQNGIIPNYSLLRHWIKKYDIDATALVEKAAASGFLNEEMVTIFKNEVAAHVGLHKDSFEALVGLGQFSSGVVSEASCVGIFPAQYSKDHAEEVASFESGEEGIFLADPTSFPELKPLMHTCSAFLADPYQQTVLDLVDKQRITPVYGLNGTGKTYLAAQVATMAASNGLSCVVVSPIAGSLRKVEDMVMQVGLNKLVFLWDDYLLDKELMLNLLKTEQSVIEARHDDEAFRFAMHQYQTTRQRLMEGYIAMRKPINGEETWKETVSRFIASNRQEGKEKLSNLLNPNDFQYSTAEHRVIAADISRAEALYRYVGTLKHPLSNLHQHIFSDKNQDEAQMYVGHQIRRFTDKLKQLQQRYVSKIDAYHQRLNDYYDHHYEEIAGKSKSIQEMISAYFVRLGEEQNQAPGRAMLTIYGVFSGKYRSLKNELDNILQLYRELGQVHKERKFFEFNFLRDSEAQDLSKMQTSLEQLQGVARNWRAKLPGHIQEEVQRLSSRTSVLDVDFQEQTAELEYALDLQLEEINEAGIYQDALNHNMLTLHKRQQYIEDILEQLEQTSQHLRDMDFFHPWQKCWLALDSNSRKVVQALARMKPNSWLPCFESWYFHQQLTNNYLPSMMYNEVTFEKHCVIAANLRSLIINQIHSYWQNKKRKDIKEWRRSNRESSLMLFEGQGGHNLTAREVMSRGADVIPVAFPIFLATDQVALEVLPPSKIYDVLVIDNTEHMSESHIKALLKKANRVVLLSDCSQDLAPFTKNQVDTHTVTLRCFHSRASLPVNMLLQTLQPGIKHWMHPQGGNESSMEAYAVHGSIRHGANEAEADMVYKLLEGVQSTQQHTYPDVGIICLTKEQRNFINKGLIKLQHPSSPVREKINQMVRNGLSVLTIDELSGHNFEIVIVSCAYDQFVWQAIEFYPENWNSKLRQLLTRTRRKVIFCHSLDYNTLDNVGVQHYAEPKGQLANIVLYAEAVRNRNEQRQSEILKRISIASVYFSHTDALVNEIAAGLQKHLEPGRIHVNFTIEQMVFPIVVKPIMEGEPPFVFLVDDYFAETASPSFEWEQQMLHDIESMGLSYAITYTANWWRDPRAEARRLASKIAQFDAAYAPFQPDEARPVIILGDNDEEAESQDASIASQTEQQPETAVSLHNSMDETEDEISDMANLPLPDVELLEDEEDDIDLSGIITRHRDDDDEE